MGAPIVLSDPSSLTTQQLLREINSLREIIDTRLNAIDKATALFEQNLTRVPTEVDKQIAHLKELHSEKFDSIQTQFSERDTRVSETAESTKLAVDAALQAAKEAVEKQNTANAASIAKSETATSKQLDGLQLLIASNNVALNDKIGDLKGRIDRGDGQSVGSHQSIATVIGIASAVAALLSGAIAAAVTALLHH